MLAQALSKPPDLGDRTADLLFPPLWEPEDRAPILPHQVPPDGDWMLWLLEGGRGSGKTEACSRFYATYMRRNPGSRGRIIAPTFGDAVEACVTGPSGLLSIDPEIRWLPSAPGGAKLVWPTGSEALVLGTWVARDVERLRAGGNRHIDWWEEMAANPQLKPAWEQAELGLRLGAHPISIGSTTPRATKAYAGIGGGEDWHGVRNLPGTVLTHATLFDNPHNSPEWVERMVARYEGTTLGRQELKGELLTDIAGALWKREWIDAARLDDHPPLERVVVAIDPAVTSGESSDDTGIIVAGRRGRDAYLLADFSCHVSPDQWIKRAIAAYHEFEADAIVAETNNGGDLVATVLRTQDDRVPFKKVHASRGKATRADPIASLYEQGRVHHVGGWAQLEDQMCTWVPGDEESPDRVDAAVWALSELMVGPGGPATLHVPKGVSRRGGRGW
jgi:phage terminase large subunit-like protein